MKSNFFSTTAGAAIFLTILGIISKSLGFFREILFASYFGLSAEFDMYLVGTVLPLTFSVGILYLGQNYLIPAANRLREKSPELVEDFFKNNFNLFVGAGATLSVILLFLSPWIMTNYMHKASPENITIVVNIFRLYLITIPLSCAVSVLSAYYQFNFEFRYPAISNFFLNVPFILALLIFKNQIGVYIIPFGYIAGSVLQVFYLIRKSGFNFRQRGSFRMKDTWKYISYGVFIIVLIETISQFYPLADRYFANYVPAGGIAALNFAYIICLLPISILSVALSTAIFPKLALNASQEQSSDIERTFNQSTKFNIALFVPLTLIMIYYGDDIIGILFERGKFGGSDTIITHQALIYYSISLVFSAVYSIGNKLLYSLNLLKQLLYITIAGIILKLIFNFLLVSVMEQNGLALSTSLSLIFFCIATVVLIFNKIKFINKFLAFHEVFFHSISALSALILVKTIFTILPSLEMQFIYELVTFSLLIVLSIMVTKHTLGSLPGILILAFKR